MKIGIGITSTLSRPDYLAICEQHIRQNSDYAKIYIHIDEKMRGVAYSKNMCLLNLSDCDYVFLFDDDCFPIMKGWEDEIIRSHIKTGQHHFLYLNKTHHKINEPFVGISRFKECGGVFMSFTKRIIETVGFMDSRYKGYGYEHAGFSQRIYKSGLNYFPYLCPNSLNSYLYSIDYSGPYPYLKEHRQSQNKEDRTKFLNENLNIFIEECNPKITFKKFEI